MILSIIVAKSENDVIGKDNKLPWHLPEDLKNFKKITTGHHILMGRKTYESIGKPLPNRTNVIITRDDNYKAEGCTVVNSISEAVELCRKNSETEAFIIGGAQIFSETLKIAGKLYLTEVHQKFEGDVFMPEINLKEWEHESKQHFPKTITNPVPFTLFIMRRKQVS
jgi:dihydrofolate reductase